MKAAIRRAAGPTLLASTLALFGALQPAANVVATGGPAGGFIVPVGSVASFTNVLFGACNSLTWGYQLNGGANQAQATFPGGCGSQTAPSLTIGPFAAATTVRVFLTDNRCAFTYFSDGTPVDHVIISGTNPYLLRFADGGGSCERETATVTSFLGCNFCVTLAIRDASIVASGKAVSGVEGASVTPTVATFTDPDPSATAADYTAAIAWGDGSSSGGVITGATTFTVAGTHTYAEENTYQISVTISDADDPSNVATLTSTATVVDAALSARPACSVSTLGAYNGPTALFTDAAGAFGSASAFSATIDWGDGAATTGTITATATGSYSVIGVHGYGSTGVFTIKTTITDDGGSTAATSCNTVGFTFAPGGGSFVIGNQQAVVGQTVTFWSSQWAKTNLSSSPKAARSFKGFAETPNTPTCGTGWSGDTGNSTPPPAGPLPEFMGVIVTSSASQTGSAVTGNTVHIVVIKTNSGYAPDPGHTGTGTVVLVVC